MQEITDLVRISNEIGKSKELVQGGGGNSSVKLPDGKMAIKASGFTFSEMSTNNGFVSLDLDIVKSFSKTEPKETMEENEILYNSSLKVAVADANSPRPSMEAGMHAFLDRVVMHTHPVMVNVLGCMKNGRKIIDELFSDVNPPFLWIDYKTPGYNLAMEVKKRVSEFEARNGVRPEIIFLKNHGIIISTNDFERCLKSTLHVSNHVKQFLKDNFDIPDFPNLEIANKNGAYFSNNEIIRKFVDNLDDNKRYLSKFLIPDDVIYCSRFATGEAGDHLGNEKINFVRNTGAFYTWNEKKSKNVDEILTAKLYVMMVLNRIGEIDFLSEEDANYLLNMESEKYRQKLR